MWHTPRVTTEKCHGYRSPMKLMGCSQAADLAIFRATNCQLKEHFSLGQRLHLTTGHPSIAETRLIHCHKFLYTATGLTLYCPTSDICIFFLLESLFLHRLLMPHVHFHENERHKSSFDTSFAPLLLNKWAATMGHGGNFPVKITGHASLGPPIFLLTGRSTCGPLDEALKNLYFDPTKDPLRITRGLPVGRCTK